MPGLFSSYWWLIFPIGLFILGLIDRWMAYQRSRDRLELLKTYTVQGKDPPPELVRSLQGDAADDVDDAYYPYDRSGRYWRRYARRYARMSSPYWAWRSAIITAAVAAGFWFGAEYSDWPGVEWPFHLVAVIMTCVAAANVALALFTTVFRPR